MKSKLTHHTWKGWMLLLLVIGTPAAVVLVGRVQASTAPPSEPPPPSDAVVLTGTYYCTISEYTIVQPEPEDPILFHELSHAVAINGTGGATGLPPRPGARPGRGPSSLEPVNLGSGISAAFAEGTVEDCVRFGEEIRAAATRLGCETSPLRTRQGVPIHVSDSRFSFVCEGPAALQIHTIGELDRSVIRLRPVVSE